MELDGGGMDGIGMGWGGMRHTWITPTKSSA